jgi:hypothetical protein
MTESAGDWIPTERRNPQPILLAPVTLLFLTLSLYYMFVAAGTARIGGVPAWLIPAASLVSVIAAINLYMLSYRWPRAVRMVGNALEVHTLFGRVVRAPLDSVKLESSWPDNFGHLEVPGMRAWIGISPAQFRTLQDAGCAGSWLPKPAPSRKGQPGRGPSPEELRRELAIIVRRQQVALENFRTVQATFPASPRREDFARTHGMLIGTFERASAPTEWTKGVPAANEIEARKGLPLVPLPLPATVDKPGEERIARQIVELVRATMEASARRRKVERLLARADVTKHRENPP